MFWRIHLRDVASCIVSLNGKPGSCGGGDAGLHAACHGLVEIKHPVTGTGVKARFMHRFRPETDQIFVPCQLAACLRMQMHRWRHAARHRQQIAIHIERILQQRGGAFIDGCDLHPGNALRAAGGGHGMAGQHLNTGRAGSGDQLTLHIAPQINQQHMRPGPMKRQCGAVGIVIIGEDNRAVARHHAIAGDIAADSAGQHHPWQIIAREHQRAFNRTLCQNNLLGTHLPHALARQMRRPLRHMVGDPLGQCQIVVIHIAEHGGARQQRHLWHRRQLGNRLGHPGGRACAVNAGIAF